MSSAPGLSPVPDDAIQRVLYVAASVHIYSIPPLTTTKGYFAASWTADSNKRHIFTARLRVLETAIPQPDGGGESLSIGILLEDPASGELFAAAPYHDDGAVEAALDSTRFFAVRVVGEGGRKAVLGVGFEERSEAIDFRIALQEARKVHGMEAEGGAQGQAKAEAANRKAVEKKDFSLKEGETIHVDIGRKARRKDVDSSRTEDRNDAALFSIPPPPCLPKEGVGNGGIPLLPPPPSAQDVKAERRRSQQTVPPPAGSAADLGFDDGEFGEFQ